MLKQYNNQMSDSTPPIKGIDLSLDNIELTDTKQKNSKALLQENKFIKKQNQILRKQLEKLSVRLDAEIKKRIDQSKKKHSDRGEEISQMELQNAYKKCQIYKKQAEQYKKKLQNYSEDKMEDFQHRVASYAKENYELKEEIKQLKKISKLQEKGLTELGVDGYSKIVNQNQKLKEQVRILKKEVDNYRRALQKSKTHSSHFESRNNESQYEKRIEGSRKAGDSKLEDRLKRRIKTQQNDTIEASEDLTDLLQQKMEKDYHKLKALAKQKSKMRQIVDNLKLQLSEKQKQNGLLKEKIAELRKNNIILQAQVIASKSDPQLIESKLKKERQSQATDKYPKGLRGKSVQKNQQESRHRKRVWKNQSRAEHIPQALGEASKTSNYPRTEERGSVMGNTIKWSHQHLSSKIKQIQVLRHQKGHIKDIHVRYEKGEPKKYDQSGQKLKYQVFSCSEDEFIKHIEGAFFDGYLQYLIVTSNHRRVEKYGNYEQYEHIEEAQRFQFEVNEKEYPGAFFGESDQIGIRKIGCLIHKES